MDALRAWIAQLNFEPLAQMLLSAAAAVLAITIHETCHGLAALALGDPTAKRAGRLSLNPLKHVDLTGLLLLIVAKVGWAKPVPIDARYFKNPKAGMAITAIAGPLSNVLLSALAAAGYTLSAFYCWYLGVEALQPAADFFYYLFHISAGLAVFNLIPVPPLDGSRLLLAFLPKKYYFRLMRYERYSMIAQVVLLLTGVLDGPLDLLRAGLTGLLAPISQWTLELLTAMHT